MVVVVDFLFLSLAEFARTLLQAGLSLPDLKLVREDTFPPGSVLSLRCGLTFFLAGAGGFK